MNSTLSPDISDNENNTNRSQNALQRRSEQLRRWRECEASQVVSERQSVSTVTQSRVQFSNETLFLVAVQQNDVIECEQLLTRFHGDHTQLVNTRTTSDGLTALHQTAIDDNRPMVQWLLNNGANVNARDNEGWTPLHASASCGHTEIVRILLNTKQCDVFAINCDGELARDVCDGRQCLALIESRMKRELNGGEVSEGDDCCLHDDDDNTDSVLLSEDFLKDLRKKELIFMEKDFERVEKREKPVKDWIESTRDQNGATVVHVCAAKGYSELLEKILEMISKFVKLDEILDSDGFTALHASAFWQQINCFEILLRFGANHALKTRDSRLVEDLCHENPRVMSLLRERQQLMEQMAAREAAQQQLMEQMAAREAAQQQLMEQQNVQNNNNNNVFTFSLTGSETQRLKNAKRQRETRRSTQGVLKEDIELALNQSKGRDIEDIEATEPPPIPCSPPPLTTATIRLNDKNGHKIQILESLSSEAERPQTTPERAQQVFGVRTRRPKRRSTGITNETTDDSVADVMSDDTNDCVVNRTSIFSHNNNSTTGTTTTSSPSSVSRSCSRSSSLGSNDVTIEGKGEREVREQESSVEHSIDYKTLYREVLKENEFLLKKVKDFEQQRRECQDFQREKRGFVRRVSELEEELKNKEELRLENTRLKDENAALIRVISKLSK